MFTRYFFVFPLFLFAFFSSSPASDLCPLLAQFQKQLEDLLVLIYTDSVLVPILLTGTAAKARPRSNPNIGDDAGLLVCFVCFTRLTLMLLLIVSL
jgi:hypothetical protein